MTTGDRKILLCMVGNSRASVPHIESVREAFESEGIPRSNLLDCLQVNAFGTKRKTFESLDHSGLIADTAEHLRRCQWRDGMTDAPYTFWNFEPVGLWTQWRDGFTQDWNEVVAAAANAIRDELEAQGVETRLSLYGVPIAHPSEPSLGVLSAVRHASAAQMLEPMDWVFAGFYPRNTNPLAQSGESLYTRRITHGIEVVQAGYGGKECVPFGWLRPGLVGDDYARVFCRAVGTTPVNRLGLWLNPKDADWAARDIAEIRKAAPYLREWLYIAQQPNTAAADQRAC